MNTDKFYAEKLANEYAPKSDSTVTRLKKLDRKAKLPAYIFGYTFGSIMALVFGTGLCLCMGVIGKDLPYSMVIGIITGVIGIIGVTVNVPIYNKILEAGKAKYAFEIIELAKEISSRED